MGDAGMLALERLPGRPGDGVEGALALQLPSDVALVDPAVELFARHCFAGREASRHTLFRLRVSLAEALANAIQFGNRSDRLKVVHVRADLLVDHIRLCVQDEGPGFDPASVPDPGILICWRVHAAGVCSSSAIWPSTSSSTRRGTPFG
jgi:hypothetical protein